MGACPPRHRRSVFLSRPHWCCVGFPYSSKSNSKPSGRRLYTSNHLPLSVVRPNASVVKDSSPLMQSVLFFADFVVSSITYETSLYFLILVVCLFLLSTFVSGFWGLRPRTPTGALPLDPGLFRHYQIPGCASVQSV